METYFGTPSTGLSRYGSLSDQELLNQIDNIRHKSPIIAELCHRLEKILNDDPVMSGLVLKKQCPICEAELEFREEDLTNPLELKLTHED